MSKIAKESEYIKMLKNRTDEHATPAATPEELLYLSIIQQAVTDLRNIHKYYINNNLHQIKLFGHQNLVLLLDWLSADYQTGQEAWTLSWCAEMSQVEPKTFVNKVQRVYAQELKSLEQYLNLRKLIIN